MSVTSPLGASRTIQLKQGPINVYERGDGPVILFVHGLFTNAVAWRNVVPLLAHRYRCITANWPFGSHLVPMHEDTDLSPPGLADIIADTIEALDLRDITLVGNDGGTMLCQLVVTRRPDRIGRLVLTPGDAYENFPPPMFRFLCWLAPVPGAMAVLANMLGIRPLRRLPVVYGWLAYSQLSPDVTDHYLGPLHDRQVRHDGIKFLRSVSNRYTLEAAHHFGAFERPVLVIWAADDRFFPLSHGERLAADFPNARLVIIERSRTYVAEDQPAELAGCIKDFVSSDSQE